jgi:hypothetical protein
MTIVIFMGVCVVVRKQGTHRSDIRDGVIHSESKVEALRGLGAT